MPPDPESRQRDLRRFDELIAVFVAFLSLGTIFFWAIGQKGAGFDWSSFTPFPQTKVEPQASPTVNSSMPIPAERLDPDMAAIAPTLPDPVAAAGLTQPSTSPRTFSAPVAPAVVATAPASVTPTPTPEASVVATATRFSDVPTNYWAAPFIAALSQRGIIEGFQDNTFQPNKPVTRAEFATMVQKAFPTQPKVRDRLAFKDLPGDYWAGAAIDQAVQSGFLNGYPEGTFQPNQLIPKVQALTAMGAGLGLKSSGNPTEVIKTYQDAASIPQYATGKVAATTEAGLVVNYPDRAQLNPAQIMTRADAAVLIYQGLVNQGKAEKINSSYLTQP